MRDDPRPPLPALDWGGLSRRRFLKATLGALGAAAAGGAVTACSSGDGGPGPDGRPLLFLDPGEAAIIAALGDAVIPTQTGFPTLAQADVIRRMDEELSFVGPALRGDVRAAIGALEWAPFVYGRFSRFSRLDAEGRRAVLKSMMASRSEILRAVGTNLKLMVHFFYFGHPSTWAAIGYDGPFSRLPPIASEQRQWYAQRTGGARSDA